MKFDSPTQRLACATALLSVLFAAGTLRANPPCEVVADRTDTTDRPQPSFQYRFRRDMIPAARSEEPRIDFSSAKLRAHLDDGASLWSQQKKCFSCHTHGIYPLARLAAAASWGDPPDEVRQFIVAQSEKAEEGETENFSTAIQVAYIARTLAAWDRHRGGATSPETDQALRKMLALQAPSGKISGKDRFPPLNSTTYHGTIAAAIAVADAPQWRANLDDAQLLNRVARLIEYLRQTPPHNDHEGLLLLWASTRHPELISKARQQELINMILQHQLPDGGWSICNFATPDQLGGGKRAEALASDPHYQNPTTDGYQTGLAIVVLRDAGIAAEDPRLATATQWLLKNQRASGRWWTRSLNLQSRFHYIAYTGTAYATWALAKCNALPKP